MKFKVTQNRVLYGIIIVLILWLIGSDWINKRNQSKMMEQLQEQNKSIVEMDKTTKEKDGQYAKLVYYFDSQKDLMNQLKESNDDLAKTVKKQDERILMLTNTVISMESKMSSGDLAQNEEDSTIFDMSLKYPNSEESFINWDGSIFTKTKTYQGEWTFGSLPLQVVLTETDRGLWKSRLIGPDWLLVDSIQVNSLPPQDFSNLPKPSNWGIYLGGGYVRNFNTNATTTDGLSIGTGVRFKNHNVIINGTTNGTVGFSYYYQFNKLKKKK
jgi:hypothetical protein